MRRAGLLVVALLVTPAWADQHDQKFSQQKWLDAPESGKDWSRADMDLPNMTGWTRARVIKLLGEPGMTDLEIDPSAPDENGRFDTYRLNSENYRSLEINYDAMDVVKYAGEEPNSCNCPTCPETPREVTMEKIKNFAPNLAKHPTIKDAEAMLGTGNLHAAVSTAGLSYTHYSLSWRVADEEHMYVFLRGRSASNYVATIDLRDAKLGRSYSLTEIWPDCLPREESKVAR